MEIVIAAIIGYIAYSMFNEKVFAKSIIATEVQRLFDAISQLWIDEFQGGTHAAAAREYVEKYWERIVVFRQGKARVIILAASILAHAAKDLHENNDQNADFVLQSFGRALGEIHGSGRSPSEVEAMILQKLVERFQMLVIARSAKGTLNKDLRDLTGQR